MKPNQHRAFVILDRLVMGDQTFFRYRLVGFAVPEITGTALYLSAEACLTEADQAVELLKYLSEAQARQRALAS